MNTREETISIIRNKIIGEPYQYGGWGAPGDYGYDCSGVPSRAMGFDSKQWTGSLYEMFKSKEIIPLQALPGTLFFYGKSKIIHVMTVLTHWPNGGITLVGARGGLGETDTIDEARDQEAFVDVVPGSYWHNNFVCALDPWKI